MRKKISCHQRFHLMLCMFKPQVAVRRQSKTPRGTMIRSLCGLKGEPSRTTSRPLPGKDTPQIRLYTGFKIRKKLYRTTGLVNFMFYPTCGFFTGPQISYQHSSDTLLNHVDIRYIYIYYIEKQKHLSALTHLLVT